MNILISHDREEESIEAKVRWFKSLSIQERADILCAYTDFILAINPMILEKKDAQPIEGRIRVIKKQ